MLLIRKLGAILPVKQRSMRLLQFICFVNKTILRDVMNLTAL